MNNLKNYNDFVNEKFINESNDKFKEIVESKEIYILKSEFELIQIIKYCSEYNNKADLNHFDLSKLRNLNHVFENSKFNGNISKWDVSNITSMISTFENSVFNGDISKWDVSNVTDMTHTFALSKFNKNISKWDVSNVKYTLGMFISSIFNKSISKWKLKSVEDMSYMFTNSKFDQDLNDWEDTINKNLNFDDVTEMFDGSPIEIAYKKPKWYQEIRNAF